MEFVKYPARKASRAVRRLFVGFFRSHRPELKIFGVVFTALALFLSGCEMIPGNWRPGWNQPLPGGGAKGGESSATWKIGDREKQDGRFVAMAISGGGSRAANFGAAVMLELQQRGLLEQVDVMSGVSGGTLPIAYYALGPEKAGPFTEEAAREAFGYDFQSSWIRRWFLPWNFFRYWFTDFTRSDIMVQVFNNRLYHKSAFGDLRPYPKILINATARNDHKRFTFTDQRFEALRSNLAGYQVANAINASSAFPGAFDDVTLEDYSNAPSYLHLYDGGPMDNLGVQAALEFLIRMNIGKAMDASFPNGCLIYVVDATPSTDNERLSAEKSDRSFIDHFINTNALDSVDAMLMASRTNLLTNLGVNAIDREVRGEAPMSDIHQCRCEVRHIALRHLAYTEKDNALASRVTRIGTKFSVTHEEQSDLFAAAKLLVQDLDDSHLLPDASMKTQCGAKTVASRK